MNIHIIWDNVFKGLRDESVAPFGWSTLFSALVKTREGKWVTDWSNGHRHASNGVMMKVWYKENFRWMYVLRMGQWLRGPQGIQCDFHRHMHSCVKTQRDPCLDTNTCKIKQMFEFSCVCPCGGQKYFSFLPWVTHDSCSWDRVSVLPETHQLGHTGYLTMLYFAIIM